MAAGDVKMTGVNEAFDRLMKLPKELRKKPGRSALGRAAAVIRKAAKENALRLDDPDTGRKIADNIGQRFRSKQSKRTGDLIISVGVLSEKGKIPSGNPDTGPKGNTPHWHLEELGGPNNRAQSFLRNALSEKAQEATDALATALDKQITKVVESLK